MPLVKHLSVFRHLIGSQDRSDLAKRRIECRVHVRLHGMPTGVDCSLVTGKDCGDRSMLRGIEYELAFEVVKRVMAVHRAYGMRATASVFVARPEHDTGHQCDRQDQRAL